MNPTPRTCGRCGAAVLNAYLCTPCERHVAGRLDDIPVLLGELDTTLARQGRAGEGVPTAPTGPGGSVHPDLSISITAGVLRSSIAGWAHLVPWDDPGRPCSCGVRGRHGPHRRLCRLTPPTRRTGYVGPAPWRFLWEHLDHVVLQEWAGTFAHDLDRRSQAAWRKVDRPPDTWYAGPCDAELDLEDAREGIARCGRVLWARLEQTHIVCPQCRTRWTVADRRAWLLRGAEDYVAPVSVVASALTLMTRQRITRSRVGMLITRGLLIPHQRNPNTVRVGDVIALVARGAHTDTEPEPTTEDAP